MSYDANSTKLIIDTIFNKCHYNFQYEFINIFESILFHYEICKTKIGNDWITIFLMNLGIQY